MNICCIGLKGEPGNPGYPGSGGLQGPPGKEWLYIFPWICHRSLIFVINFSTKKKNSNSFTTIIYRLAYLRWMKLYVNWFVSFIEWIDNNFFLLYRTTWWRQRNTRSTRTKRTTWYATIHSKYLFNKLFLSWIYSNYYSYYIGYRGPPGPKGLDGFPGEQGARGPIGAKGGLGIPGYISNSYKKFTKTCIELFMIFDTYCESGWKFIFYQYGYK